MAPAQYARFVDRKATIDSSVLSGRPSRRHIPSRSFPMKMLTDVEGGCSTPASNGTYATLRSEKRTRLYGVGNVAGSYKPSGTLLKNNGPVPAPGGANGHTISLTGSNKFLPDAWIVNFRIKTNLINSCTGICGDFAPQVFLAPGN